MDDILSKPSDIDEKEDNRVLKEGLSLCIGEGSVDSEDFWDSTRCKLSDTCNYNNKPTL